MLTTARQNNPDYTQPVGLPIAAQIAQRISETGPLNTRAPVNNNALQVGFRGRPEGFMPITATLDSQGVIGITFAEPRAVEGPIRTEGGRVGRYTTPEISRVLLSPDQQAWNMSIEGRDGNPLLIDPLTRLVLARTVAKTFDRAR